MRGKKERKHTMHEEEEEEEFGVLKKPNNSLMKALSVLHTINRGGARVQWPMFNRL
jgi:hypothetical protein